MINAQAESNSENVSFEIFNDYEKRVLIVMPEDSDISEINQMTDVIGRSGINVVVASLDDTDFVKSSSDTVHKVDVKLSKILKKPPFDALILPGGLLAAKSLAESKVVRDLLREYETNHRWIVAIGDAPSVLRKHFIGAGKTLTCNPLIKHKIEGSEYMKYKYIDDDVFVDGKIVTCKGGSHTTQCALNLVHLICGRAIAENVAKELSLEYDDGYCRDCCGNCKYCCREDKKEIEVNIADRFACSTCCSADDVDVVKWQSEKLMTDVLEKRKIIFYKLKREEIKDYEKDKIADAENMKKFIEEDREEYEKYKRMWDLCHCDSEADSYKYKREYVEGEEARYNDLMRKKYDRQNLRHERSRRRQIMIDKCKDLSSAEIDSKILEFNRQEDS